jgi:hypothetical protein
MKEEGKSTKMRHEDTKGKIPRYNSTGFSATYVAKFRSFETI